MRVTAWLVPLLALSLAIAGCAASAQPPVAPVAAVKDPLASSLYDQAISTDTKLVIMERSLPDAIKQGDAKSIENSILVAGTFKRTWHTNAASATGKVADAARKYEESITIRTQMYEQASLTARLHSVEASRAMVRFQTQGWDLADQAEKELKALE